MDKIAALKIAKEFVDTVRDKFDLQKAILFGSFAKGTNHDDSDIDIALVINNLKDSFGTQVKLMKLRRKIDLRIEPHPFSTSEFNNSNPVVTEILKNGLEIN